jgi:hypothetical protein
VHGKVAAGFEEAAASHGFAVFMMTGPARPDREERALTVLAEHRADGVALASCVSDPADVFRRLPKDRVVFVQPDYPALADGAEPRPVACSVATTRAALPPPSSTSSSAGIGGSRTSGPHGIRRCVAPCDRE